MKEEDGLSSSVGRLLVSDLVGFDSDRVVVHSNRNIGASIASGSYPTAGMIVVPCSMRTLAAISCGYCDNLIQRAADVILKEQKKLVIVPRETPLSVIHLENMLKLARLGVSIVPAMPGFYHQPQSISDLVDMMVMRIIDQMGFRVDISSRWKVNSIVDDVRSKAEEEHVTGTNCFK
jgi:4-hydroxy-3-polyprenylbenzoate decarboxylase